MILLNLSAVSYYIELLCIYSSYYIIVVRVGYTESSYTISDSEDYVEICIKATSPGIEANFSISSSIENITSKCIYTITYYVMK